MDPHALDGRISQGWGGTPPNGVHVNVVLAARGSATAAAVTSAFASPTAGFTPILISLGPDQPSYETLQPPTIMLNKMPIASPAHEALVSGACQVGIARGVLDAVAQDLLRADQETLVLVSLWVGEDAADGTAVCAAARAATGAAIREAVQGRSQSDVQRLVDHRDAVTHPFYDEAESGSDTSDR
jgi:formaldehyde-activating enzyme